MTSGSITLNFKSVEMNIEWLFSGAFLLIAYGVSQVQLLFVSVFDFGFNASYQTHKGQLF